MNDVGSGISWTIDQDNIAEIHMNDTEGKNVFSHDFVASFLAALDAVEEAEPCCLILRGMEDVFCGGADKQSLMDLANGTFVIRDLVVSERLVNTLFPVISAMEGHAMGGGLVVGLCSDMVVMANESRYSAVFMSMGFTPGMGTTTLLQHLVGEYNANEMMLTAKRYKGKELKEKGVGVNYIVDRAQVYRKARQMAQQIAEKNKKSVYLLKYALSAPKKKALIDARLQEDHMHRLSFGFPETKKIIDEVYGK